MLIPRATAEREGAELMYYESQPGYELGLTDTERVYFSSDREFARGFAAQIQGVDQDTGVVDEHGALYEVEPVGEIEKDPDFNGGVSWCAPRARIIAVSEPNVRLDAYEITKRVGPYMSWLDGSPIYTANGGYLPSPEQKAGGCLHPMFGTLPPWTPVEYVNAWLLGQPSGARPAPCDHPGVALGATEAGAVFMKHFARAKPLMERGVEFSTDAQPHLASINRLLDGRSHVREDDDRGVVVASQPGDGVIGAIVFTATVFDPDQQSAMFIDDIGVAPGWQGCGLGSVLLLTAQTMLPSPPSFAAGHCEPEVAPFFAQAGYTVLRPGVQLRIPLGDAAVFDVGDQNCWFYRQGPA